MQRSGKEDLDAAGPVKSPWPFPSKLLWGAKVKNPAASPGRLRLQAEQTSTLPSPPGASHGGLLQEKAVTGRTSRCPQPCGLRLQQDSDSQKTPPSASTSGAGGWWGWGGRTCCQEGTGRRLMLPLPVTMITQEQVGWRVSHLSLACK